MLTGEAPPPDKRGAQHHLCLEVPDAAAAIAALDSRPYRKQYTRTLESRTGVNRKRQVNLFDPDGTRTELMEPVTNRRQARSVFHCAAAALAGRQTRNRSGNRTTRFAAVSTGSWD